MARGNQRDLAREKNLKKQAGKKKGAADDAANKVGWLGSPLIRRAFTLLSDETMSYQTQDSIIKHVGCHMV